MKTLLVVPGWLGGARTVQYILRHKWCHWLILWPLLKLRTIAEWLAIAALTLLLTYLEHVR